MDRQSIVIQFPERPELIHQIRNFGEVLFLAFRDTRAATISLEDVDKAEYRLVVQVRSKNAIRSVQKAIVDALEKHRLKALVKVSVEIP